MLPNWVDISPCWPPSIWLNTAVVSAAMEAVTKVRTAIALAPEGGIGIIHRNLTIEDQAREASSVFICAYSKRSTGSCSTHFGVPLGTTAEHKELKLCLKQD